MRARVLPPWLVEQIPVCLQLVLTLGIVGINASIEQTASRTGERNKQNNILGFPKNVRDLTVSGHSGKIILARNINNVTIFREGIVSLQIRLGTSTKKNNCPFQIIRRLSIYLRCYHRYTILDFTVLRRVRG